MVAHPAHDASCREKRMPPAVGIQRVLPRPSRHPPLDALAAIMLVLCLSWGFNQVAVKLAIHDIPPLMQAAIRSVGAALIVAAWCEAARHSAHGARRHAARRACRRRCCSASNSY